MKEYRAHNAEYHSPLFEHMATMNDEVVWDLMEMLYGLVDAYEAHYADVLQRLRRDRQQQLYESWLDERQLQLLLPDNKDEPF